MRALSLIAVFILILAMPASSYALGLEIALGGWQQTPSGTMSYGAGSPGDIDLVGDAGLDREIRLFGRVKIEMPHVLPDIYIMATPLLFEGTGSKDAPFKFGGKDFKADESIKSSLDFTCYDVALYYGMPFLETATRDKFNLDLGLNMRIINFRAELEGATETARKSMSVAFPMLYVNARTMPVKRFAFELDTRVMVIEDDHMYSIILRLRAEPVGPMFLAGGYRYEDIKIERDDVRVKARFLGPFVEAGVQF